MRFLFIAALVLLSAVCYASEMKQKSLHKSTSVLFAGEQPAERDDCLGWFRGCDPNNDKCCEGYVCNRRDQWCKYKLG
uniref:Kappa-Theraphotoxin-Sfo1a_4 n=1 Tax=Selenotholus foelschei TaxID=1905327 RepID=A0A482Z884_9ARAC